VTQKATETEYLWFKIKTKDGDIVVGVPKVTGSNISPEIGYLE
jgi:hypothetical protein